MVLRENYKGMVPGMSLDLNSTDPEIIRKEVIPKPLAMGEQGWMNGTINDMQFRNFMTQVLLEYFEIWNLSS